MADLSNKKSFAGAGLLTALGIIAGGALGERVSIITGVALAVVFALIFLWFIFRGPEEVEVRFADEKTFGFLERLLIRRTINNCCIYLRRLGLNPPSVSPILGVHSLPVAITPGSSYCISAILGTACICSSSGAPDTARFMYQKPYRKTSIASLYLHSYLFRLLTRGGTQKLDELSGAAQFILELYFCHAFADEPLISWNPDSSEAKWVDALLTIRNTCGEHFTDTLVAYTLQLLVNSNHAEGEAFASWFYKSLSAAILNTVSFSNNNWANRAISILVDYGVITEEIMHGTP